MKRKGIPKKRIGPEMGTWERSIRKRQFKVTGRALNAAERSTYEGMSISLCGIKEEKKENDYLKEVMKVASSGIYLTGRSRERLTLSCASAWVKPCTTEACSINACRFKGKEESRSRSKGKLN